MFATIGHLLMNPFETGRRSRQRPVGSYPRRSSGMYGPGNAQHHRRDIVRTQVVPGLCGLNNMGNSCYMSSAIQCLLQMPQLSSYFITGQYRYLHVSLSIL